MKTITAIIPAYNAGVLIEEAIASVLAQTRPPDEIIVVDDGSSDDTGERARRFGARIRYHAQPNAGSSAARNAGIYLASSSWIAFLDADDLWMPQRLERQEEQLSREPETEAVFGLLQNFMQPGCDDTIDPRKNQLGVWQPAWLPGTVLIRRETLARTHGFDAGILVAEAVDWIIRLREAGVLKSMTEIPALRRRLHRGNKGRQKTATNPHLRMLRDYVSRQRAKASMDRKDT